MSVKPVADEIIVVDTGSTDKTKAIASALGAKVFDFPWTNDFSEARNYSLSKASGDSILVLDADEIISPLDHAPLRSLIQQADKRFAYSMTTRNYTYQVASQNWTANDGKYLQEEAASGWLPSPKVRMFVNDKRIRFVNAVHELVEPTLKDIGIRIKNCSIPVHHYGRLNQDRVLAKGEEYYRLGKKKVLETKGDYKALKELAIQACSLGHPNLLDTLASLYCKIDRRDEAEVKYRETFEIEPTWTASHIGLAYVLSDKEDYREALRSLDRYATATAGGRPGQYLNSFILSWLGLWRQAGEEAQDAWDKLETSDDMASYKYGDLLTFYWLSFLMSYEKGDIGQSRKALESWGNFLRKNWPEEKFPDNRYDSFKHFDHW